MRHSHLIGLLLVAALLTGPSVATQTPELYGSVAGTVTDPNGSRIAGGAVVLRNVANGLFRETATNADGEYAIIHLQPGSHDLRITIGTRFQEFRQRVSVTRGNVTRADAQLQAGTPENAADLQEARRGLTSVRPFVRLDKTLFLVGEQVFFWVGVSAGAIPDLLCDTGRVTFTRPDGTQRVDRSGCPLDGPRGLGWRGGRSLGSEVPQVGRWVVVYEFAGHRSEPASFIVAPDDIVSQIEVAFVFSSPLVLDSPEASVTLTVRNRSAETVRFPHRNRDNLVSVRLNKTTGEAWGSDFFVPQGVLLAATVSVQPRVSSDSLSFTWELAEQVPTVSLPPGRTYQLRLPVAAALEGTGGLARIPAGEYEIRLYTLLQTLVGSPDGSWKDLSPLRLEVTGTAHGVRR